MNTDSLVFVDTETTGLVAGYHEVWEIALYDVATRKWTEWKFWPEHLERAEPEALLVSGFYERARRSWGNRNRVDRDELWANVALATSGKVLCGIGPWFDAKFLEAALRERGLAPGWHHRLVDVKALAVGSIVAHQMLGPAQVLGPVLDPPWSTTEVAGLLGIYPDPELRHTARGDVELALHMFSRVVDGFDWEVQG